MSSFKGGWNLGGGEFLDLVVVGDLNRPLESD